MRLHPLLASAATALALLPAPVLAATSAAPAPLSSRSLCAPAAPGRASCTARVATIGGHRLAARSVRSAGMTPATAPAGYSPTDIRSAYSLNANAGAGTVVGIVDAYDDPNAESDLAAYRSQWGLPVCSTANGCFRKVGQVGTASYPAPDAGWAGEIALDIEAVSAACPLCHIVLVEANSSYMADLMPAVDTAVAAGATVLSLSFGGPEYSGETTDDQHFNHPGVAITVSSGDNAYGVEYPASSPYVTAVGGTALTRTGTARGWSESVWYQAASGGSGPSGPGSGCSAYEAKPAWQHDAGCGSRTVADVSAVADPNTGLAVYSTYGNVAGDPSWGVYGGTSLASPLVAAMYAQGGGEGSSTGAYPFYRAPAVNDVTTGSNGSCAPAYLCTAVAGYDGPTGLGTPAGPPAPVPAPTPAPATTVPASVSFGTVTLGSVGNRSMTLANSGTAPLAVSAVSVGGASARDFTVTTPPACATLAAGASCTVALTFRPTTVAPEQAILTVTDNAGTGSHQVTLAGTGSGLHVTGVVNTYGASWSAAGTVTPTQWGFRIARDVAVNSTGGEYVLDGYGGVHPAGGAAGVTQTAYWSGWDIARALALRADGHSGWVLDGYGGLHSFGGAPDVQVSAYWPYYDIARDLVVRPDGRSGYVLDGFGHLHPFAAPGTAMPGDLQTGAYWPGWDIAHRMTLDSTGAGGFVVDGYGGLHPFGTAAPATLTAYWSGWDIARGVVLSPGSSTQGWVLDGYGGLHPFGGAPAVATPGYSPGYDVFRGVTAA